MTHLRGLPRNHAARPTGRYRSSAEADVDSVLQMAGYATHYERFVIHHEGRTYTPDIVGTCAHGPRLVVEVKPSENVARGEVRLDMLTNTSPLWVLCDVFVIAFPRGRWLCCGVSGQWFECGVEDGDFEIGEPADWLGQS